MTHTRVKLSLNLQLKKATAIYEVHFITMLSNNVLPLAFGFLCLVERGILDVVLNKRNLPPFIYDCRLAKINNWLKQPSFYARVNTT